MSIKRDYRSFDILLAILVVSMAVFGVLLIASANGYPVGNFPKVAKQQILWVITGIIIMLAAAFIDYQFICKFYIPIYFINIIILLITIIFKIITKSKIYRSISIGSLGTIQPSEFSKLFMIIFLSKYIDKYKEKINHILVLGSVIALTLVPVMLIMILPSLSASLVTLVIMLIMLFISKVSYKYIALFLALILPLSMLIFYDAGRENPLFLSKVLKGYQITRIATFVNPEEGSPERHQLEKSMESIGSGQLEGKGIFKFSTKVPEPDNDCVFSVVGEEFGFIGSVIILAIMLIIIIKCFIVAYQSNIFYGKLMAAGIGGMFAFQVFVHVGVNIGIVPVTGMVFPFLSAGGSSMWVNMALVGLVLNIGMTRKKLMFED